MKIEISDVQRLALKPGDRIIVRMPARIDRAGAELVERQVRARLGLPDEVPVLVLPEGMSLEVVEPPQPLGAEITRALNSHVQQSVSRAGPL